MTTSMVDSVVQGTFARMKSAGYRKVKEATVDEYAGLSQKNIQSEISGKEKYSMHNVKFRNKAIPRPVTAQNVQEKLQLDLMDFQKDAVKYKGKTYKYILSIMDVFSRFLWLKPLPTKTSASVANVLKEIFDEYGPALIIQMDNGMEFRGEVSFLCKKYAVKEIRSRPYHHIREKWREAIEA